MGDIGVKKVSVVVPNYNYVRYLRGRLQSILKQTYPIYELIILDDASTDGSREEIFEMMKKWGVELRRGGDGKKKETEVYEGMKGGVKIKIVINEKNSGGAIAQWRKGFELAEGEFVWIAEADDLCSRKFLAEVMKGFEDSKVVLSYTESMIMNGAGLVVAPNFRWSRDKEKTGHYKKSYVKEGRKEIEEIMAIRCTIPNASAVVLRNDRRYLKYLDEASRFLQVGDWYFYAKVLKDGKISYNRRALNKFRVHGDSKTGQAKGKEEHFAEIVKMHEYFRKNYDLSDMVIGWMKAEEERLREKMLK